MNLHRSQTVCHYCQTKVNLALCIWSKNVSRKVNRNSFSLQIRGSPCAFIYTLHHKLHFFPKFLYGGWWHAIHGPFIKLRFGQLCWRRSDAKWSEFGSSFLCHAFYKFVGDAASITRKRKQQQKSEKNRRKRECHRAARRRYATGDVMDASTLPD